MTNIPPLIGDHGVPLRTKPVVGNCMTGALTDAWSLTDAYSANQLYAAPFWVPWVEGFTTDQVDIYVSSGSAGNLRLGLYESAADGSLPGSQFYAADEIDVTSSGSKVVSISPDLWIPQGLYWLLWATDATPTCRAHNPAGGARSLHVENANQYESHAFQDAFTYAALPASAPASWDDLRSNDYPLFAAWRRAA